MAFPGLRGGVVNFMNADAVVQWSPISPSVQPGAQHNNLPNTAFYGRCESVFCESMPNRDEHAHSPLIWVFPGLASDGFGVLAKDAQR
jgi:hypothetical protein